MKTETETYAEKAKTKTNIKLLKLMLEANGHKLYNFGDFAEKKNEFYLEFPNEEGMSLTKETLETYFQKIYSDLF